MNATDTSLALYDGGGWFKFTAIDTLTLTIDYYIYTDVKAAGDQGNEFRPVANGTTLSIDPANYVEIIWSRSYEPLLPIMFILGMFGLASMFAGPIWFIQTIKKRDWGNDALLTSFIITVIGIALFAAWLTA